MDLPTIPINGKRILVVDDNVHVRQVLSQVLEIEGYNVLQAPNGDAALRLISDLTPDLIISDMNMPNIDGAKLYTQVRENPNLTAIPFIFLTSNASPEEVQRGKELGVEDCLVKPVDPNSLVKIVNARLLRAAELQIALIDQAYLETIKVIANTIEGRDPYTHGHVERVANYADILARALKWPAENMRMLAFGARLHDIGKISVPDSILNKAGGLLPEEWEKMKQHTTAGAKILQDIRHLQPAVPYVLYHHERWDGSGYPYGLVAREIPLEGRLLAIADVYDALSTKRSYHPARPHTEVVRYMTQRSGIHFDPDLVPIFIQALEEQGQVRL